LYAAHVNLSDASTPQGDRLDIPPGWRQGRGAFGGFVIGAALRAIEARVGDPSRVVRSVTAELPGPAEPGTVRVATEVLRRGHTMTTARASLSQGDEIRTHVVAILAAPRRMTGCTWQDLSPPTAPAWTTIAPLPMGELYPEFAANFEYRLVEGIPVSGGTSRCVGWIRARDPGPRRDAAYVTQMIDAWWPGAFVRFAVMRPCATIAFTLEIFGDASALDPEAPLLYRGVVPVCSEGYFVETRELWTADGALVALNHQTFAVIR
jgi:acyl-CoA thioesterase